ncbi:MAG: hypothetical protein K1X28_09190 [Parachlamydiales bacterium]|nr:hypothetical protein [Parachlamydiales bacterium]
MKISVDNQVIRLLEADPGKVLNTPLENGFLNFSWPSILEYLGLGGILGRLPPFDERNALFVATVHALCEVNNPEDLFYVYDSLFTETIKQIKSLKEIDAAFLLEKIGERKEIKNILTPALAEKEKRLRENGPEAMHDLILYLAWDRMCVRMGVLFDHPSKNETFLQNLKHLKWCLLESFLHIAGQGRTNPSFYRLIEALFYYQMREERMQTHQDADWELLTQSFQALKNPNELVDYFYIDHAIASSSVCHLTLDPPEIVQSRLDLANYMISQLKAEIPTWNYSLSESHIIHLSG